MHWFLKLRLQLAPANSTHTLAFAKASHVATTNTKRTGKYNPTMCQKARNILVSILATHHNHINSWTVVVGQGTPGLSKGRLRDARGRILWLILLYNLVVLKHLNFNDSLSSTMFYTTYYFSTKKKKKLKSLESYPMCPSSQISDRDQKLKQAMQWEELTFFSLPNRVLEPSLHLPLILAKLLVWEHWYHYSSFCILISESLW